MDIVRGVTHKNCIFEMKALKILKMEEKKITQSKIIKQNKGR